MRIHPRGLLLTALLAVVGIAGCDAKMITPTAPPAPQRSITSCPITDPDACDPPPPAPITSNPKFGVVGGGLDDIHLTGAQVRERVGAAKRAGVGFVLDVIYWDFAQPTWGQFDPGYMASVDTFVAAVIDSGMMPYIKFQRTPAWARLCYEGSTDCDSTSTVDSPPHPAMFNAWKDFIGAVLDRYPQVTYWGVWNEPNGFGIDSTSTTERHVHPDTTWGLKHNGYANWFDAYYLLFGYAADVIQSKPGRVIVGPELGWGKSERGLSPEAEFANFVNALNYRFRPQDILSVHYYGTPDGIGGLSNRIPVLEASATNAALGANQIWVTEVGWGDEEQEGADDYLQARSVTDFYQALQATQVRQWTKLFKFSLWHHHNFELIRAGDQFNPVTPVTRPAYYCYQALALHYLLPAYCN